MRWAMEDKLEFRRGVLAAMGATREVATELLAYNSNQFDTSKIPSQWPLPDESFVETWRRYCHEVEAAGSIEALSRYLIQLRFPVQAGISSTEDYLAATRLGRDPSEMPLAIGLALTHPESIHLSIHPTTAGHIPVLVAEDRRNFIALVQAFTRRNEPRVVPSSMGACMVSGYNNWHRISELHALFLSAGGTEESWPLEFKRLTQQKDLYQDRFMILSTGPYSGVAGSELGSDDETWRRTSLVIRREHECTHYFTQRVFSSMRNNLLDELIADYFGITAGCGRFRADWLLRFFGLESYPHYRQGGRLQNYLGDPPLSDAAFAVLQRLLFDAALHLQDFDWHHLPKTRHLHWGPALLMTLAGLTIEEIAAQNADQTLTERFAAYTKSLQPIRTRCGGISHETRVSG
jgi:hypothetical protein